MKRLTLLRLSVPAVAVLLAPALAAAPAVAAGLEAPAAPIVTEVGASAVVGQTVRFRLTDPGGSEPARYNWMINGGELTGTVAARGGKATVKILATRAANQLAVYAVDAQGGIGDSTTMVFTATDPSPYADQDLDGDGRPDLAVVVGDTLLEADGRGTGGRVRVPAIDLGPLGNGVGGTFAGAQIITGKFSGSPFEDYLAYYPSSGLALAYRGHGAADRTYPRLVALNEVSLGGFFSDENGDNPIQLATAYDGSGLGHTMPDLLGVVGNAAGGFHLDYYVSTDFVTGFYQLPVDTGRSTPAGGSDWENWRLSSKLLPGGTAVSLWNPSTGALYLWTGVTFDAGSGQLSYTQYRLSAHFRTGDIDTTLRLTDFDGDGVPDIWGVSAAGVVTAYRVSGRPGTIKAAAPQPLT